MCLNENNNGTFVNLTELDETIIEDLEKYVLYIDDNKNIFLW